MNAVKFLAEWKRLCNGRPCATCPMFEMHQKMGTLGCNTWCMDHPEASVTVVEKWAEEHPRKTRQSVFLEQWPEAKISYDGSINIMPCMLCFDKYNVDICTKEGRRCGECRRKYWLQEVE